MISCSLKLGKRLDDNPPYDLVTWAKICYILASFKGLRAFNIEIGGAQLILRRRLMQRLFDPLYEIHTSTRLVILAPDVEEDCAWELVFIKVMVNG